MRSSWHAGGTKGRHLVRGIAIFFMLYTAADLAAPQLCHESLKRLLSASSLPAPSAGERDDTRRPLSIVSAPRAPRNDQTPRQSPQEGDDCLGCCKHILPDQQPLAVPAPRAVLLTLVWLNLTMPSPALPGTYRPPRFA